MQFICESILLRSTKIIYYYYNRICRWKQGELMNNRWSIICIGMLYFLCNYHATQPKNSPETPELTVVIVIDQFAYSYLPKLMSCLGHGIHDLVRNGVVYLNAFHPNGAPVTAVGHTGIGTGCLAKHHGIIDNDWVDDNGTKIVAYAAGPKCALTPTLNKPFLAADTDNHALAISLKGRAAMGLAGNDAPAIWIDNINFVTNAKQKMIIDLVSKFNATNALLQPQVLSWQLAYADPNYYQYPNIDNYTHASASSLITASPLQKSDYEDAIHKLPVANQLAFDLSLLYLQHLYQAPKHPKHTLLWLSLSTLDKVGHLYGPESRETIDTIYHLDKQIQQFMRSASSIVPINKTLYVLTGDHGVMPIPELLEQKYPQAKRVLLKPILKKINHKIHKKFGIKQAIISIEIPFVYLNLQSLKTLPAKKRSAISRFIIKELQKTPGVAAAYATDELALMKTPHDSPLRLLQNNILPGRSGQITILVAQYAQLTKHEKGTTHQSPYSYNTHVPLILYWPEHLEQKTITQKVWIPQIHATLAKILNIAPASSCTLSALPGLFNETMQTAPIDSTAQNDHTLASCVHNAIARA